GEHLQIGISPAAQVIAERIDALRARLVFLEEVRSRGHQFRRRHPSFIIHDAVELGLELALDSGVLQSDHAAARHPWVEAYLIYGLKHADRVIWIRENQYEIRIVSLDRANDRREVGRARRVGFVVHDLEAILFDIVSAAIRSVARELGVLGRYRDRFRPWILRGPYLGEALAERLFLRRARRQHGGVFRVVELTVRIEREQTDERLALLHDGGNGWGHHVRPIRANDEVNLVDVEQLRVDGGHILGSGLVVVIDKLDGPAQQAALGVGLFFPDLSAEQRLLAGPSKRAGLRHAEADLDGFAALRKSGRRGQCGRKQGGADPGVNVAPRYLIAHGFPPESGVSIHGTLVMVPGTLANRPVSSMTRQCRAQHALLCRP